ncbi:hypothetical protein PhCBS80983_g02541 [Powellomyces hirtus]|uniref:DUF1764 domain-containing protein n=1 Tax=Powellomyces hirtus TaxID=109895 RepID=A0A507E6D3_9FUNG|nr:hypothetical protein PhCBS80983_g02541 [Powellomyces hirtus]
MPPKNAQPSNPSEPTPSPIPAKRKAASEIDDIFSGKKPTPMAVSTSALPPPAPLSKSQRKKLKSRQNALKEDAAAELPPPPLSEESTDPAEKKAGSGDLNEEDETFEVITDEKEVAARIKEARSARPKPVIETVEFKEFSQLAIPAPPIPGDDGAFGDSRGALKGKRKTEDGLGLFTTDELNIGKGEGDTPQCPFECWCCF